MSKPLRQQERKHTRRKYTKCRSSQAVELSRTLAILGNDVLASECSVASHVVDMTSGGMRVSASCRVKLGTAVAIALSGGRTMHRIALTAMCSALLASLSYAQQPDPLGSVGSDFMPAYAPSADTEIRSFVLGGERYDIPRNFLLSVEYRKNGEPAAISMRALLPDIVGITRETLECLKSQNACEDKVVTIGLLNNPRSVSGSQQPQNIRSLAAPTPKMGPCGLEFYETTGQERQRFRYYFKNAHGDADMSILRCPDERSDYAPFCVSQHNPVGRVTFYYDFDRKFVCDWAIIGTKIRDRIATFKR
jgi:hypothetical protein